MNPSLFFLSIRETFYYCIKVTKQVSPLPGRSPWPFPLIHQAWASFKLPQDCSHSGPSLSLGYLHIELGDLGGTDGTETFQDPSTQCPIPSAGWAEKMWQVQDYKDTSAPISKEPSAGNLSCSCYFCPQQNFGLHPRLFVGGQLELAPLECLGQGHPEFGWLVQGENSRKLNPVWDFGSVFLKIYTEESKWLYLGSCYKEIIKQAHRAVCMRMFIQCCLWH